VLRLIGESMKNQNINQNENKTPEEGDLIKKFFGDVIYTYTSEEATEDGFLFDLDLLVKAKKIQPYAELPIKYITTNLLDLGYWKEENDKQELNLPNILDLVVQALRIFRKKPQNDYFVSGNLQLPSGKRQKVFLAKNETGRYTLMLPGDY
jgi:hypothetical protein